MIAQGPIAQLGDRLTKAANFIIRSITASVFEIRRGTIEEPGELLLSFDDTGRMLCPGKIVIGALQQATSGTFKDFPIPAGTKRITLMCAKMSMNGTANLLVQLGVGTPQTTGYDAISIVTNNANGTAGSSETAGFPIRSAGTTYTFSGSMTIMKFSDSPTEYTWVASHAMKCLSNAIVSGGGDVTLTGFPTMLRVTSLTPTEAFDNGALNVMCE